MKIVQIRQLENGGHMNQQTSMSFPVPAGWALVPDDLPTPNFPFGNITVETIDGTPTVTNWSPLPIPEPVEPEDTRTPAQKREDAYNQDEIIDWGDIKITVTHAATLWEYYSAEGNVEKASELQGLIKAAKEEIRAKYPDEN